MVLPPSLYFLNLNQKLGFPKKSDNNAIMAGFSFLPRYNTMSAGLIKIGSGVISSRRTTPITCHTFYAGLFLHYAFLGLFFQKYIFIQLFCQKDIAKGTKDTAIK